MNNVGVINFYWYDDYFMFDVKIFFFYGKIIVQLYV